MEVNGNQNYSSKYLLFQKTDMRVNDDKIDIFLVNGPFKEPYIVTKTHIYVQSHK